MYRWLYVLLLALVFFCSRPSDAGDDEKKRTQYPTWMQDSFYEFSIGYIDYPFTTDHLIPGNSAGSIHIPHASARVTFMGHRFNRYLSGQLSVLRPAWWVRYRNVNGTDDSPTTWTSIGSITARGTLPLTERISLIGEGGIGIVSRHGFTQGGEQVMSDANYVSPLFGGGMLYHVNRTWDFKAEAVYVPGSEEHQQPYTMMITGGAVVNLRAHDEEKISARSDSDAVFPLNTLQMSWSTNALGIGFNDFVSDTIPIFWGGDVKVEQGLSVRYLRNIYHTKSLFSLDVGFTGGYWKGAGGDRFWNLSVYKQFKLTPIRTDRFDVYLFYAVGGPSYISKSFIDGIDTGKHFTFIDLMGGGVYLGADRDVNIELSIGHFSNGNLFSQNAGIMIPMTVTMGFTF